MHLSSQDPNKKQHKNSIYQNLIFLLFLVSYREGVGGAFVEWQVKAKDALSRSTSGISQARSRVPVPVVYGVVAAIEEEIRMSHEKHTWQGQRAFIIDGTDFRVKAEGDLGKKYPP